MDHRRLARLARLGAAGLVVAGGAVHLRLALAGLGYPDRIERAFLLNAAGSAAAAAALVVVRHWSVPWVALGVVDTTMLAFGLSRTDRGVLGFQESGWSPAPEAALALAFELGAATALIGVLFAGGAVTVLMKARRRS